MTTETYAGRTYRDVAKSIDHSLLRPELDDEFVADGCRLAARYDVASVCVKPVDVARAAAILAGTDVKVGTVIGFPHGSSVPAAKGFESPRALADGGGWQGERGGGGRFGKDLDRFRADRRHARGPGTHAPDGLAARPGQGGRRRAHTRRPAGGHGPGRDALRGHRHEHDPGRLPGTRLRHSPGTSRGRHDRRGRLLTVAMTLPLTWMTAAAALLERVATTQAEGIEQGTQWGAEAIAADGLVHLFGTGHSRIPVEEMFPRYGSYPRFNPLLQLSITFHTQLLP